MISAILTPLVRREIPLAMDLLSTMPAPKEGPVTLFLSIDDAWEAAERDQLQAALATNIALRGRVSLAFIDCRIPPAQSIYFRRKPHEFVGKLPRHGLKSGPNLQFFRSVRHLMATRAAGAVMLVETDAIALCDGWLARIEEDVGAQGEFLVAGAVYSGRTPLPPRIEHHLNGNAVINIVHPEFAAFLQLWEDLLLWCVGRDPSLAYDVVIEWAHYYRRGVDYPRLGEIIEKHRPRLKPIKSVVNLAGPHENAPDFVFRPQEHDAQLRQAALLHCKAALAHRVELMARKQVLEKLKVTDGHVIFDSAWQYPAITEQHAARQIAGQPVASAGQVYVGFPWATYIDLVHHRPDSMERRVLEAVLQHVAEAVGTRQAVTVCQHIFLPDHIDAVARVGVRRVFWSHATRECRRIGTVEISAFPLYPVQAVTAPANAAAPPRDVLFSFVGAKAKYVGAEAKGVYLSNARNIILERLSACPDAVVSGKEAWHYEQIVYGAQINKNARPSTAQVQDDAYRALMLRSVFALCPSGTGPNTIRLWEAIGLGAIPVILAETYLPPGDPAVWADAAVFCSESPAAIAALPDRLRAIASDPAQLARRRSALQQLWRVYGPANFVEDIRRHLGGQKSRDARATDNSSALERHDSEMNSVTAIFIATPTFNSAKTISRTISSVLAQSGPFTLHYHVQDGNSTDATLEIVRRWKALVDSGQLPISCRGIEFSYSSEPDAGMYDAIAKAFARAPDEPKQWMGWINSDDFLNQGAFAYLAAIDANPQLKGVHWIVPGAASIAANGYMSINKIAERPISGYLAKMGLCDGVHWDFVQQEGSFFRKLLWDKIDVERDFRRFRYAGDWNLWRSLAQHGTPYQSTHALGVFNVTPGQLSVTGLDKYYAEIEACVPAAERLKRMANVAHNGTQAHYLRTKWNKPDQLLATVNITELVKTRLAKVKNALPAAGSRTRVVGYPHQWQFPAITEKWAYEKVRQGTIPATTDACYVAFPWATFIDMTQTERDTAALQDELDKIADEIAKLSHGTRVITVCQHILTHQHFDLIRQVGITDLFWSHATRAQPGRLPSGLSLHPFPLYPVQWQSDPTTVRDLLFSFVGARNSQWYLSNSRQWILDLLSDDPRGAVVGRDGWHYQKIVYDVQINQSAGEERAVDENRSEEFRRVLARSIFSLCPSGTGPNSIRLWESIGTGAIPVILADTYLPPGDPLLWEEAAVFCDETAEAIRALPDRLEAMARDGVLLERKRKALRQLWLMYGPDCFIYDIQKLMLSPLPVASPRAAIPAKAEARQPAAIALKTDMLQKLAQAVLQEAPQERSRSASQLLRTCTTHLLLDPTAFQSFYRDTPALRDACREALRHAGKQAVDVFTRTSGARGLAA